ncbi:MAG: DUF4365 domain-containing protein [Dehalococcoidia bacterium]|nr:DUF4365 domain-containing protein [Dehalococcoidia bacterium]
MTPNLQMEQFSIANIGAVAAQAGFRTGAVYPDLDSMDGIFVGDSGRRPRVEFQLKATSQDILRDGVLHFPLPINNYDDLRLEEPRIPRILIVVRMPEEVEDWLSQSDEELCMRRCAYWISLRSRPSVSNTSSVTVHIPLTNMFNKEQLTDLMDKAERGIL